MNGLKKFLADGGEVLGSRFDGKVKNVTDLDSAGARRVGYVDANGDYTELGGRRLTSVDYDRMGESIESIASHHRSD